MLFIREHLLKYLNQISDSAGVSTVSFIVSNLEIEFIDLFWVIDLLRYVNHMIMNILYIMTRVTLVPGLY